MRLLKNGKKIGSRMDDNIERAKAFFSKYDIEKKDTSRVVEIEDEEQFNRS